MRHCRHFHVYPPVTFVTFTAMADASSLPPQCSHFIFVLVNSQLVFNPRWTKMTLHYIVPLFSRLREGNRPSLEYIVTYSPGSPVKIGPFCVEGGFKEANLMVPSAGIMERISLDMATFDGYMSIIEVLEFRALFESERYSAPPGD
jgi:hypothetical protein